MQSVSAVVLAGGKSSRFGSDKALADLGGIFMIEKVVRVLDQLCDEIVIATNENCADLEALFKAKEARVPVKVVVDGLREPIGPVGGLAAGMKHVHGDWCFAVACDMPYVTAGFLTKLKTLAQNSDENTYAFVPVEPSEGTRPLLQPLCAIYRTAETASAAQACVAEDLRRVRCVLEKLPGWQKVEVGGVDADAMRNINRPSELASRS